jgi:hypothetical protein
VVGDLQQFLDPATGQAQNVHGGPCPERVFVLVSQIAPSAGGVAHHQLPGQGAQAGELLPVGGEGVSGLDGLRRGQQLRGGGDSPPLDGGDQHRQNGQTFTGAGVHACFAMAFELPMLDIASDRAWRDPLRPARWILQRIAPVVDDRVTWARIAHMAVRGLAAVHVARSKPRPSTGQWRRCGYPATGRHGCPPATTPSRLAELAVDPDGRLRRRRVSDAAVDVVGRE